jgi:hypothetical protein
VIHYENVVVILNLLGDLGGLGVLINLFELG